MIKPRSGIILALFLSVLAGCGEKPANTNMRPAVNNGSTSIADIAKSNVEELGMMVRVPYEAEDIAWKQDPSDRHIIAIFRFSPEDSDKLVAEAEKRGPGRAVSLPVEPWYPEELIAQGEVSGDSSLKGTAYSAGAFFQEPFTTGRISRVEGVDYFILEVSPK